MENEDQKRISQISEEQGTGIRFLVESALRTVATGRQEAKPKTREEWLALFCKSLVSDSETSHKSVIASLMANGMSNRELYHSFIPDAARIMGEMWVQDRVTFVDVHVGASRLQSLFRSFEGTGDEGWIDRTIPLGQSVLIVVPEFENHSLGAFVAADQFRKHGLWVHMALALKNDELVKLISSGRFSMVGITVATLKTVDKTTEIVDYIRANTEHCPPIVIGGRAVDDASRIEKRTGADFAVITAREAIERCGLASVARNMSFDAVL